ncbi:MAG: TrkA family potassium uptake protein [Spirochaetales bacterium]|nr:TrkA family potassium uptake protein [Spirochaetales bacterium]
MAKTQTKTGTVFAVLGIGSFGHQLCEDLMVRGGKVIALDVDPEVIAKIKDRVTQAIIIDAADDSSFFQANLGDVDIAIVAMGNAIESSILTTALLKSAGIPYIIARAVSSIHERVLRQVGADEIINLEEEGGTRLATRLLAPRLFDRIPLSPNISLVEFTPPRGFEGKSLVELELRKKLGISVVAVKRFTIKVGEDGDRDRNEDLFFPDAQFLIQENDVLVVVGENDSLEGLHEL